MREFKGLTMAQAVQGLKLLKPGFPNYLLMSKLTISQAQLIVSLGVERDDPSKLPFQLCCTSLITLQFPLVLYLKSGINLYF